MSYKKRYDSKRRALYKGEYQRYDGRYMYRWTDYFGKRHAVYASDLDTLRIKEEKIELNRLEGIRVPPSGLTIESLYDTWISLKRGIRSTTRTRYKQTFDTLIRPSIGKKLVIDIKRSHIRAFYITLLDEKKLSIGSVENVHTVLHQVFQYAVDDDILRKNPCDHILREIKLSYSNLKGAKRQSLTIREEINFLKYLQESPRYARWYPTFFIMANTGLRVGELTGLRWKDIDLDNGIIDVNHTLVYFNHMDDKGSYFSIHTPKTENGIRKVIMTQAVKDAFLMEKEYQEQANFKSFDKIDGYENFIFINSLGHIHNQASLNRAIHRIVNNYNIDLAKKDDYDPEDLLPHFSCHILRHTYATRMIESGASWKYTQYSLGHSEIQTTMDIYVSVSEEFQQKENESFEEYMKSAFTKDTSKNEPSNVIITKLA